MKMMSRWLACLCVIPLAGVGCSGNSNSSQTPAQVLQGLEASGDLPTLDITTSLTGTDADGNGVRDDLDKYVAGLADSSAEKKALIQEAQAIQASLVVDLTQQPQLLVVRTNMARAVNCVWTVYPKGEQHEKVALIQELSINTLTRLKAYEAFNSSQNGITQTLLDGSTCN